MSSSSSSVVDTLRAAWTHLSPELRRDLGSVFEHHLATLAASLERHGQGPAAGRPEPHLAAETTPSPAEVWRPFAAWWTQQRSDGAALAAALDAVGIGGVLLLLGQRTTPASLTDASAVPPTRQAMMAAAERMRDDGMTVAGRAWTKHAGRSGDSWWGAPTGTVADKNAGARQLVVRILDATTWWNVFGHGLHEAVLEARVRTGHGARWSVDGDTFVGFLDPFEQRR
ncbi:MAG: hypothetical protein KTR31_41840 [Myxococcales bacterium]|nr:hypothetical protein [Myxococcales bacterium]